MAQEGSYCEVKSAHGKKSASYIFNFIVKSQEISFKVDWLFSLKEIF